jgi:hypothetical protein
MAALTNQLPRKLSTQLTYLNPMENYSGIKLARLSAFYLLTFFIAFLVGKEDLPHWLLSTLFAVGISGLIAGLGIDYFQTNVVANEMLNEYEEFAETQESEADRNLRLRKAYAGGLIPYVVQAIYKEDAHIYPAISILPAASENDAINGFMEEIPKSYPNLAGCQPIYIVAICMNRHEPDTINVVDLYDFYKKSRNGDKSEDPEKQFTRFLSELDIKRHLEV